MARNISFEDSPVSKFLLSDTRMAGIWLLVRLYVGWAWLVAGWHKVQSDTWVGSEAGKSLTGFVKGALAKTAGDHPDVTSWYASFLENIVLPNASTFSYVVAWGELLVGVALIVGIFTGVAAFFGLFMNLNFLLAGAVSTNPILFTLAIGLILSWKIAGYFGLDRYVLSALGTPWQPGRTFTRSN